MIVDIYVYCDFVGGDLDALFLLRCASNMG